MVMNGWPFKVVSLCPLISLPLVSRGPSRLLVAQAAYAVVEVTAVTTSVFVDVLVVVEVKVVRLLLVVNSIMVLVTSLDTIVLVDVVV